MNLPTKTVKINPEFITMLGEDEQTKNPFEGHVMLSMPTYLERLDIAQRISGGEEGDKLDAAKRMVEAVKQKVTEISLSFEGESITSFDDLSFYEAGAALINELGAVLTKGVKLGKLTK